MHASGTDPGLIFKIKLTVENHPSVPIRPNKILPEQGPPARSKPLTPITVPSVPVKSLNTVIPDGPSAIIPTYPSKGQRLLNLVRGAVYDLNSTNPDATIDRWLCLSSSPPYYEGIAYNGDFNKTSNHASCSWGMGKKLTMTDMTVSGESPGLCIGTPPPSHHHLCGQTHSVSRTDTSYHLVPSPVGWWACNTGLTHRISTNVFEPSRDFCESLALA